MACIFSRHRATRRSRLTSHPSQNDITHIATRPRRVRHASCRVQHEAGLQYTISLEQAVTATVLKRRCVIVTVQKSRSFITTLLVVALLGAWFSGQNQQMSRAPLALAQTSGVTSGETGESAEAQSPATESSIAPSAGSAGSTFEDGYRAGYRDSQQDCSASRAVARTGYAPRARSAARVRVAGVRYEAPRKGHSTRNMILRIAAPAAIGAGIGAIAGGGKGAGAGALIGGGGGALWQLLRHRRD
jgi:hypothetical protein